MLPGMDQNLQNMWRGTDHAKLPSTAPYFKDQINRAEYGDWLTALPSQVALSLYLYVPYYTAT
jgi:hypothetical protein